jgi:hypothetical protein
MALAAMPGPIIMAMELQLAAAAIVISVAVGAKADAAQSAALATVAALGLLTLAPWFAATTVARARRIDDATVTQPRRVAATVTAARRVLTIATIGPTATLALTVPVLAGAGGLFSLMLAIVATVGLIVRAIQVGYAAEMILLGASGLAGLFAVLLAVAELLGITNFAAVAVLAGGVVVLCGLIMAVPSSTPPPNPQSLTAGMPEPEKRNPLDVVGLLCNLAIAPLAMGAFGVFAELTAMGRTMF